MKFDEARDLTPGTLLKFGDNPQSYKVVSVDTSIPRKIYINLLRDDDFETFVTETGLDAASVVSDEPKMRFPDSRDDSTAPEDRGRRGGRKPANG